MKYLSFVLVFYFTFFAHSYQIQAHQEIDEKQNYPQVDCPANQTTIAWVKKIKPKVYGEFGIATGSTVCEVARVLPKDSIIYLFDYHEKVAQVKHKLAQQAFTYVIACGNSYKLRDSYNWSLMKLLQEHTTPIFDYVYIDGMHTWDIDGFAFFLIDKLLKPGGYIDFDDYNWSLKISPTLNPTVFPLTTTLYTQEQINTQGIKLVVDLLVRRDKRYKEIVSEKIFQKQA